MDRTATCRVYDTPVEAIGQRFPDPHRALRVRADSGGAGRYRGSLALRRDIRVLTGPVSFAGTADRHTIAPQGLFGGHPAPPAASSSTPSTNRAPAAALQRARHLASRRISFACNCRAPAAMATRAVAISTRSTAISATARSRPKTAEAHYTVVVDRSTLRVDRPRPSAEGRHALTLRQLKHDPAALDRVRLDQTMRFGTFGERAISCRPSA